MTRPDAYAVAAAMNARPLDPDTDGGEWYAVERGTLRQQDVCQTCNRRPFDVAPDGEPYIAVACYPCADAMLVLCLPCAMADVQRAHEAADPNSHTDREVKS